MSATNNSSGWRDVIAFPLGERAAKPRHRGLTMVMDKGLGTGETQDLLRVNSQYIDFIKLGFGTPALYADGILEEKIHLACSYGIYIYPGGTFFEIALWQDKLGEYLDKCKSLGFTAIEVSDGTINICREVRARAISMAADRGFLVLTEVGKKNSGPAVPVLSLAEQASVDLQSGAFKVIMEGRECGLNVGLYDAKGKLSGGDMELLLEYIGDPDRIIWEAPLKSQQQDLITRFGSDVNLGNIHPQEVLALEALRLGLRADTLQLVVDETPVCD